MDNMLNLTAGSIEAALDRLETGVERYSWLQQAFPKCDVARNETFQTKYNAFYKVRRNAAWRREYFALMQAAKESGIDFPGALAAIKRRTGSVEASFASKLVATLRPATPVIDKFVLQNFGLALPGWASTQRDLRVIAVYRSVCVSFDRLLNSPTGELVVRLFDRRFPGREITPLKKLDLVLWQTRA